jgi:IclR family pca regulon transcriptional regulator
MGTQEISFVSVLDGFDVVYVARNGENRNMNTSFALGARVPAHVTAAGMMLLASFSDEPLETALAELSLKAFTSHTITDKSRLIEQLKVAQQQDWALSEQQLDLSYRGVSVPLRDHKGRVLAALSVSMPIQNESTEDATARVLPLLKDVAQSLRQLL